MYAIRLTTKSKDGSTRKRFWYGRRLKDATDNCRGTIRGRRFSYCKCSLAETKIGIPARREWTNAYLGRSGNVLWTI